MPDETNDIKLNQGGDGNRVEFHAENQQANKIVNIGINQGDITNNYFGRQNEIKPTNKFLCRKLIEAIQDYSPNARYFVQSTIDDYRDNWETQDNYLTKAKEIITSSFASVLGQFLSNLIGSDNQKDYFDVSLAITKRTLQLLCFAFISSFWDHVTEKKYKLTSEQQKHLKKFFFSEVDPNINFYADLFKALVTIFQEQQLDYPIPEIKIMEDDFKGENVFFNTCRKLDTFRSQFENDQSLPAIDEIEKAITSFLVSLKFMARYKMVSVKKIDYDSVRKNDARYVHAYTILGVNSANNSDGEKYQLYDKPINTDAVLLFRDKYMEGLNLFPFVVDLNALKNQSLTRICFYCCNEEMIRTLTYFNTYKPFYEKKNDADLVIKFDKELEDIEKDITEINKSAERDITELKKDDERKYKTLKMYEVYKTFQLAKQSFFPEENV